MMIGSSISWLGYLSVSGNALLACDDLLGEAFREAAGEVFYVVLIPRLAAGHGVPMLVEVIGDLAIGPAEFAVLEDGVQNGESVTTDFVGF